MYREGGWLPKDIEVEIYNPQKVTWIITKGIKSSWPEGYKKTKYSVVNQFNDMKEGSWVVKHLTFCTLFGQRI